MAVFDAAYQAANRDKVSLLVPEVYELVNIAIALTPKAREEKFLVMKDTPYYRELLTHFTPVADHAFVKALEERRRSNVLSYFDLKMNGYAFEYGPDGAIRRSSIYDRTGFSGKAANALDPLFETMQSFSRDSNFRQFYAAHRELYQSQIDYFRTEIDIARMLGWLKRHFPAVKPYDTIKVVFSPLVYGASVGHLA